MVNGWLFRTGHRPVLANLTLPGSVIFIKTKANPEGV